MVQLRHDCHLERPSCERPAGSCQLRASARSWLVAGRFKREARSLVVLSGSCSCYYLVPNSLSPASPSPGRIYPTEFSSLSSAAA